MMRKRVEIKKDRETEQTDTRPMDRYANAPEEKYRINNQDSSSFWTLKDAVYFVSIFFFTLAC